MTADPRLRASDDDRDRAATLLREHHAVGRLTAEEFNERLDKVYAARTMGDLDGLLADLPGIDLYRLPDASLPLWVAGPWGAALLARWISGGHPGHGHLRPGPGRDRGQIDGGRPDS